MIMVSLLVFVLTKGRQLVSISVLEVTLLILGIGALLIIVCLFVLGTFELGYAVRAKQALNEYEKEDSLN